MTNLSKEEGQGCSPVDKYNAGLGKIGGCARRGESFFKWPPIFRAEALFVGPNLSNQFLGWVLSVVTE